MKFLNVKSLEFVSYSNVSKVVLFSSCRQNNCLIVVLASAFDPKCYFYTLLIKTNVTLLVPTPFMAIFDFLTWKFLFDDCCLYHAAIKMETEV